MSPIRAGLAESFFFRLRLRMRVAAVLFLIGTLQAVLVQAVPVPTYSTTLSPALSGSKLTSNTSDMRSTAAHITHTPNPHTPALLRTDFSTSAILPSKLLVPQDAQKLVLVRRWNLGSKIKSAFHHVGHTISHAAYPRTSAAGTVAHAITHAGHFIAHHGPAIAKVGLKIAATVGEVAGKAAPFIPGLGSVAGKALVQGSKKLNSASNAIHVHIGGKLGTVMHGMDVAQRIAGKIP